MSSADHLIFPSFLMKQTRVGICCASGPSPVMANSRLLITQLRRSRPISSLATVSQLLAHHNYPYSIPSPPPIPSHTPHSVNSQFGFHFYSGRFFSSGSNEHSEISENSTSLTDSELIDIGHLNEAVDGVANSSNGYEDSIFPVRALISLLDGYHGVTGLPWWMIIVSSTVGMRLTLLPLLVLQLHKLKRISELLPKLPPPFPPPLSGKSYVNQFRLFQKERRALGSPSYLWFLAAFSVQVPCFFLWVTTIRKMSLDHHPGFDSGGALWFQNLTEFPHGVLGPIFPLLIASLHYLNVQLSFDRSFFQKMTGPLGVLARYYKMYLNFLTLPLFFIGYCIPQGSLIYWVTNSSLSAIQQLSLRNPTIRAKLGLPDKNTSATASDSQELIAPETTPANSPEGQKVPAEKLSPKQLVAISVQLISSGNKEKAAALLKLALEKDPDNLNALILMGQTLLQKELYAEANEYLERAISKLLHPSNLTAAIDVGHLILVSQWAGVACIRQGNNTEGISHLERVANLKEPDDSNSKFHYFNSLIFLASALVNEGRKAEAVKYMRLVVAYNPDYKEMLEQFENEDNFVSDLANSRRGDY